MLEEGFYCYSSENEPSSTLNIRTITCKDPEGDRGSGPSLKNHKNIGFPSDTGPDHLNYNKATKPAFDVGPSWARQRNAIEIAFRWRTDEGPFIVVFGSSLPLISILKQQQKPAVKVGHRLTKLSGSSHVYLYRVFFSFLKHLTPQNTGWGLNIQPMNGLRPFYS